MTVEIITLPVMDQQTQHRDSLDRIDEMRGIPPPPRRVRMVPADLRHDELQQQDETHEHGQRNHMRTGQARRILGMTRRIHLDRRPPMNRSIRSVAVRMSSKAVA